MTGPADGLDNKVGAHATVCPSAGRASSPSSARSRAFSFRSAASSPAGSSGAKPSPTPVILGPRVPTTLRWVTRRVLARNELSLISLH